MVRIFTALNSNRNPSELARALSFGFLLAILPAGNLLWLGIFLSVFFLKVNRVAVLFLMVLLRPLQMLTDPIFEPLGYWLLNLPLLRSFWIFLYNVPFVPFTDFNRSLVTGSLAGGLLCFFPLYGAGLGLLKLYRRTPFWKRLRQKIYEKLKKVPLLGSLIQKIAEAARFYASFR